MSATVQRGLGYAHQVERRRLLPHAYGWPCPMCGRLMLRGQDLDLDHVVPRMVGGPDSGPRRIVHASCNRKAGANLRWRVERARVNAARSRVW